MTIRKLIMVFLASALLLFTGANLTFKPGPAPYRQAAAAAISAEPFQISTLDAGDGVAIVSAGINRFYDSSGNLPSVNTTAFTMVITYNPGSATVVGVRAGSGVTINSSNIDNVLGSVTIAGSSAAGVPYPGPLASVVLRSTGSATQPYNVTVSFSSINGGTVDIVPASVSSSYLRGDARADGAVNITDALFVAQYLAGLRNIGSSITAEVNAINASGVKVDGTESTGDRITVTDALMIAQYLAGTRDGNYNLVGAPTPTPTPTPVVTPTPVPSPSPSPTPTPSPSPSPSPTPAPTPSPTPLPSPSPSPTPVVIDAAALYASYCAGCHGANRQGAFGPPLTASALAGKTVDQIIATITNGKPPMPSFSGTLTAEQISALANWLKNTP